MQKLSLALFAALFCLSCNGKSVKVTNPLNIARTHETVEVEWSKIRELLGNDIAPDKVVVQSGGTQIPSQILYKGGGQPLALIFQATVPAKGSATYTLKKGTREAYPPQTFGRQVPERMDDFAWENNRIAFRMYGPALEATGEISNGIDVWVKSTPNLIIDNWYASGDYHVDHGEGFDGYKVGRTLGAGAMAPFADGKLWPGNNYTKAELLDLGPVRVSFRLHYAAFDVNGQPVSETRDISLDANTSFNRITECYSYVNPDSSKPEIEVAAGIIMRNDKGGRVLDYPKEPIYMMGYWEPTNHDNNTDNGNICVAVITPTPLVVEYHSNHVIGRTGIPVGQPYTYLMGAGWSKGGFPTSADWSRAIVGEQQKFANPLQVKF